MRVNIKTAAGVLRQLRRRHGHAAGFAPTGRWIVAAGEAARPQGGPTRNPWKAYEEERSDAFFRSSPRRGEGDFWADERTPVPGASSARLWRPVLHPWIQSAAPLGRTAAFVQFFTLHSALVTPVPALLYGHRCPQVSGACRAAGAETRRARTQNERRRITPASRRCASVPSSQSPRYSGTQALSVTLPATGNRPCGHSGSVSGGPGWPSASG